MPNKSPEHTRRRITEELRELERRSFKLKTEWNTCAPISNIPDEILMDILEAAREVLKYSAWYQLLGVCSHWRSVAIGAPTLWTKLPTHQHELTLLMLERSKNVSLDVQITKKTSFTTVVQLSNHIGRIRLLKIGQTTTSLCRTRDFLLDSRQEFSRLAELSVEPTEWPVRPEKMALPSSLFCRMPTLRAVTFKNVALDWNIFPLPNLIELNLCNIRYTSTARISACQLLQTLGQMPRLEYIRLDRLPMLHDISKAGTSMTNLPHLLRLGIAAVTPGLAQHLLSHMSLPSLQCISILDCYWPDSIDSDYNRVVQAIFSVITNGNFGPLENLRLEEHRFQIRTSAQDTSMKRAPVEFSNHDIEGSTIPKALIHVNSVYSLLGRIIRLHLCSEFSFSKLLPLCDAMVSVEIVEVVNTAFCTFTKILAARQPPDMLFPKLKTIEVDSYRHFWHGGDDPDALNRLYNCLVLRRDYGVPVHTVHLCECRILIEDVDRLREVVRVIKEYWD